MRVFTTIIAFLAVMVATPAVAEEITFPARVFGDTTWSRSEQIVSGASDIFAMNEAMMRASLVDVQPPREGCDEGIVSLGGISIVLVPQATLPPGVDALPSSLNSFPLGDDSEFCIRFAEDYWIGGSAQGVQRLLAHEISHTIGIFAHTTRTLMEFPTIWTDYLDAWQVADLDTGAQQALATRAATAKEVIIGNAVVSVTWRTNQSQGVGTGVKETPDYAYFWFFNPENAEIPVKILNGCDINGFKWVFAGPMTNVEVTITVTDLDTGLVGTYHNPLGHAFQAIQDTTAFPCN